MAGLVFLIGAAISMLASGVASSREKEERRADFEQRAAQVAMTARIGFDIPLEVLRSLPALFEASDEVTRDDFRAFVRDALERYPWIYALEWIPRVPAGELPRYVAAAEADGIGGYHVKEDAPEGPPVPSRARGVYFPLFYMEPLNETALGIEETALEARRIAIERARDLGQTVVTERLRLVQDEPSVVSVIGFHPVFARSEAPTTTQQRRRSLRGLAAAVFRIEPVVTHALREVDLDSFDVTILDTDAEGAREVLYQSRPGAAEAGSGAAAFEHVATIGGRRWLFRVSDRAGWVEAGSTGSIWLGIGLLASALAAGLVFTLSTVVQLRRQVDLARQLGQYTLVEKLGEGGMGAVYRAHHALLRRPTAIKLLDPDRSSRSAMARFEREVQATSTLTHPHTIVVYDYGHTAGGIFYYAMEYIDGVTLQQLVDACGAQRAERVVNILLQVCGALEEAHRTGLVHRDVKPANIMLCNRGAMHDFVKVVDFGLVKDPSEDGPQLSNPATLLGTPLYMAPESIASRDTVDGRADIYALGAVAYFLLTGEPVFEGATVIELCAKHLSVPPDPPSGRAGGVPITTELEAVVMRCLEKDPDDRFESAAALARALEATSVRSWTDADARQWWDQHGDTLRQRIAESERERPRQTTVETRELVPRPRHGDEAAEPG